MQAIEPSEHAEKMLAGRGDVNAHYPPNWTTLVISKNGQDTGFVFG
jgi:hypothetical protein